MKNKILFVKSLENYLRDVIRPILNNPASLKSGKIYKNIQLRPREVLGVFLVCLAIRYISNQDWTIARDPEYGDGVILCKDPNRQLEGAFLEQVYVRLRPSGYSMEEIIKRINMEIQRKVNKGKDYAQNRHLVIFLDVEGLLNHQKVREFVNGIQERFYSYWLFAPYSHSGNHNYVIFLLKAERDQPAAYEIKINDDFRGWTIRKIGTL